MPESEPTQTATAADPTCLTAANTRARDAALNGYDKDTQRSIRQESYNSCVTWGKKAVLVESGRH